MSRISKVKYKDVVAELKKKPINWDKDHSDPFSLGEAHKEQARTIDVPKDSNNPIHKFLRQWGSAKFLIGHKAFCLNDRKEIMSGFIVDVIPPYFLHLKNKGVARFSDVVSIVEG